MKQRATRAVATRAVARVVLRSVSPRAVSPRAATPRAAVPMAASSSRATMDDPRFVTPDSPNREACWILQEISKQVSECFVGSFGKMMKTQNVVGVCGRS